MTRDAHPAARPPDYAREHHAVTVLTRVLADDPGHALHALVDLAREICDARHAGISLLDAEGHSLPQDPCPDGDCLEVTLHDQGKPMGTLWLVGHTIDRPFDAEDVRLMRVISALASAGWHLWRASEVMAADSRRKDDFLATLAHELRNPLSAITAATAVLQQRTQPPSAAQAVGLITRQTQHMARLIGDLLDIAGIVSGHLELQAEEFDLRTVVSQTIETRRAQITRKQQTLYVQLGDAPALISGDPVRLAQVVSNLIDNAAKYTPEHGDISVVVAGGDSEVTVSVRDSGAGIPTDQVRRIFQPFTRLHTSLGSAEGGLGLGLALARTLAQLHGGTVTLDSAGIGHGSCFTLRLPR